MKVWLIRLGVAAALVIGLIPFWSGAQAGACDSVGLTLTRPTSGQILSGNTIISARSIYYGLQRIDFLVDGHLVGSANPSGPSNGTNTIELATNWNTTSVPDGNHYFLAHAFYGGGTSGSGATGPFDCQTPNLAAAVHNSSSTQAYLRAVITPAGWQGPTNQSAGFSAAAMLVYPDGSQTNVSSATNFSWSTTIGTIEPNHSLATFYSGPNGGSGQVKVLAGYNGQTAQAQVSVSVYSSTQYQSGSGATSDSGSNSGTSGTSGQTPPPVAQPLDSGVEHCLRLALGDARFDAIDSGKSQPTTEERLKSASCFRPNNVIPAPLAPVAPSKVPDLPSVDKAVLDLSQIKNVTLKAADGKDKTALQLSGKSDPNATVFIYIFSEPLVLTTTADSSGNWSYTLQNPLAPGKHQAYVTVAKDSQNFVRSDAFGFDVAQAAASDQNPQGNSLALADSRPVDIWYFVVALIAIGAGIRVTFIIRKRLSPVPAKTRKR